MTTAERLLRRVIGGLSALLAWALVAAVVLNLVSVTARYVFGQPIFGVDEIQVFIVIWIAFGGAAVVSLRREHLRMDVLVAHFPQPVLRTARAVEAVLTLAVCGLMAWQSSTYALVMFRMHRTSDAAGVPLVIPHAALAAGFALVALVALTGFARRPEGHARAAPLVEAEARP